MTKAQKSERDEAIARIRESLSPGDTVHCILRYVSRSGMSRVIQLVRVKDGETHYLGFNAALALGMSYDRQREGVKIGGCGMDMGFALVYELSAALWPEGFGCIGERCSSNDHSNGDRDYTPYPGEGASHSPHCNRHVVGAAECSCAKSHWHRAGGYALRHQWL